MKVDTDAFKDLFANWPSGVAVVTCVDADGAPQGFTASSVISVSMEPPLLLFALKRDSGSMKHFSQASAFAINTLTDEQDDISTLFATPGADRFRDLEYDVGPETGAPLIKGAWGRVECEMYAQHDGGDHVLFVGRIVAIEYDGADPLVYHRRGYRAVVDRDDADVKTKETAEATSRP